MTKYRTKNLFLSFKFAFRGLFLTIKTHRNFQIGVLISIFVMTAAVLLKFNPIEIALTSLSVGFVLFAELVNSTIESIIDTYFGNNYSEIAKISKDVAAGTVLIALLNAIIIGALLFFPKLTNLLY